MSGPQFIHLETFARETSKQNQGKKGDKQKTNIKGVIGEALREVGFTSHLANPRAPIFLIGKADDLVAIETEIYTKAGAEKDPIGRKIRADANLLIGGVVSYPKPAVAQNSDDRMVYELWKELTLDFLKGEFGDNLRCVLEHTDEEYPHLHFYVLDRLKVSNTLKLHPGHRAKDGLKDKKAKEEAYRNEMTRWQDKYYSLVASDCGLTRLGPKVQRLSRPEWKAQKQQATALSSIKNSIDVEWESLQVMLTSFEQEKASFDKKIRMAVKDALSKIRGQYDQGIQMLGAALDGLKQQKQKLALRYPDQASNILTDSITELQASNIIRDYEEAKEETKQGGGSGSALKPPTPKPPWSTIHK